MQNKVPIPAPNEVLNDRKEDIKLEEKKKTQAEIEQEMATLQYTNPQLLEVCDTWGNSRWSKKVVVNVFLLICSWGEGKELSHGSDEQYHFLLLH